jgi:hypothetical protein
MAVAVFAPITLQPPGSSPSYCSEVQPPAFIELLNPLSHIAQGGRIVVCRALEGLVLAERSPNALCRATGRARATRWRSRPAVARPLLPGPLLPVGYQLGARRHVLGVRDDQRHEHDGDRDHRMAKRYWRDLTGPDGGPQ